MIPGPVSRRSAALAYLAARTRFGIKFGLDTIRALLDALGSPQNAYPALLVAGTNGKGSVVAYCDAILRASGRRVGRYTSPHLVRVHERIVVGGRPITDAGLERAIGRVRRVADDLVRRGTIAAHPTYFEVVTAAALDHFRRARVDVAVLEVGLGGRLDATNASDPIASAIVTVDRDHEAWLGKSLPAIAREKAGVMRRSRPTVLGPLRRAARDAVEAEARRVGARLVDAAADTVARPSGVDTVDLTTPEGTYTSAATFPGAHQRQNLAVAVRLLEEARREGLVVEVARGVSGLRRARWPGRLQWLPGRPPILLDGAHNPAGARALSAHLRTLPPFVLVFGAMGDKDVETIGRSLFPLAAALVLTRAPGDRAAGPDEIAARVGAASAQATREPSVGRALARARRLAGPGGIVVVAGSLYLVGDVLRRRSLTSPRAAGAAERPQGERGARAGASLRARRRPPPRSPRDR